jgi:hypothetical protein
MYPAIDNPDSCEINTVIRFLHAKNITAAKIHRELCVAVYDRNVTSEGTVGQRCRMFKEGRTNVHHEERNGRPYVMSDDPVHSERRRFTISELSCEIPRNSRTFHYEFITLWLGYQKFYARWVPKVLTGAHKTQRTAWALTIFTALSQRWRKTSESHCTSNT